MIQRFKTWQLLLLAGAITHLCHGADFQELAGALPRILKADAGPYLVTADIEVPSGKTVTIEAGSVLLFREFTGLHIMGRLNVNGTKENPVVFTSQNNKAYNSSASRIANPYDWNGLYVHSDALGSAIRHAVISYSVYGMISETKFIRLDPVQFLDNGRSNLVIEDAEKEVGDAPFRYVLSVKDATVDGVPVKLLEDPLAFRRNSIRMGGLACILAGLGGGIFFAREADASQKDLIHISDKNDLNNLRYNDGTGWNDTRSNRDLNIGLSSASFILAGIGAWCFSWSFRF